MRDTLGSMWETLVSLLPQILAGLGILVVGWFIALIVRALTRKLLGLAKLDQRVKQWTDRTVPIEKGTATAVYLVILLFAVVGCLNVLNLGTVSDPINNLLNQIFEFLPRLIAGGVLALLAWVFATLLRRLTVKALASTSLDEKLSTEAGVKPIGESLGHVVYWLVILLFLPAILGAFQLEGLLQPVQQMMDKTLAMLPNIVGAALIGVVGWFIANLLRNLVTNVMQAAGADRVGEKLKLPTNVSFAKIVGLIVYIFVFVPALIAALDALRIEAISRPATDMLGMLMRAVPNIIAAGITLTVAWFIAGFVGTILTNLLSGIGFDDLPAKLGFKGAVPEGVSLSQFVGRVAVFFLMLFAAVEAANRLDFTQFADMVGAFIEFGGQVLLGVIVIVVGFWISNLAHRAILGLGGKNAGFLANLARIAIIGIVLAMGLRAMQLADSVVNMAFGFTLGAVAVAVALSFGLGGREAAGRQMEHWLSKFRGERE